MFEKITKSEKEWRKILTPEQFHVMREKGTESPYSCAWRKKDLGPGVFYCAACNLPLFSSEKKFESGTGWPSYFEPINLENIEELKDETFGMQRIEVRCARCEGHLGHVFRDGPAPTRLDSRRQSLVDARRAGKRYCINSIALNFKSQQNE